MCRVQSLGLDTQSLLQSLDAGICIPAAEDNKTIKAMRTGCINAFRNHSLQYLAQMIRGHVKKTAASVGFSHFDGKLRQHALHLCCLIIELQCLAYVAHFKMDVAEDMQDIGCVAVRILLTRHGHCQGVLHIAQGIRQAPFHTASGVDVLQNLRIMVAIMALLRQLTYWMQKLRGACRRSIQLMLQVWTTVQCVIAPCLLLVSGLWCFLKSARDVLRIVAALFFQMALQASFYWRAEEHIQEQRKKTRLHLLLHLKMDQQGGVQTDNSRGR
mmetsp:Transcript_26746/g.46379  ORF Transcript_26746/g.46379 Transcript_26746/m.46379 type:complete len:271 (+) Transcript_26746:702-1514(+)